MFLNYEYPAPNPTTRNLVVSLLFGAFITLFLIFFEPFEINIASGKNSVGSLLFFGMISTVVLLLFLYLLPLLLPKLFDDQHWKVKHQIVFCTAIMLAIATLNGLFTNYINSLSFSWSNYWWIINRTFVLGCIPFSFLILIDYQRRYSIHKKTADSIKEARYNHNLIVEAGVFSIVTDLKNESFAFEDEHFTHAIAVGNYTDLYFLKQGSSTKTTYRISLSSFEKQINNHNLCRCHRSYLVNLHQVTSVSGNSQGLRLTLSDDISEIPVSRKYIPHIKKILIR